MKYVIKGRVISMNGKEKDMIILKSIIKEIYVIWRQNILKTKGEHCVYHKETII